MDEAILQRAQDEDRAVITFDKDFGELAFRWGLPATSGVILFRLRTQSPGYVRQRVVETLAERVNWLGHFFVVEEFRIRIRPLRNSDAEKGETNDDAFKSEEEEQ